MKHVPEEALDGQRKAGNSDSDHNQKSEFATPRLQIQAFRAKEEEGPNPKTVGATIRVRTRRIGMKGRGTERRNKDLDGEHRDERKGGEEQGGDNGVGRRGRAESGEHNGVGGREGRKHRREITGWEELGERNQELDNGAGERGGEEQGKRKRGGRNGRKS